MNPTKNKFKAVSKVDYAFKQFIGNTAFEDDGGWSHEVWRAAWEACLMSCKQCNMCGSMVTFPVQPDLPGVSQS
jgi:hypothetical protein